MTKEELRSLMFEQRIEILQKKHELLSEYLDVYKENTDRNCDLMNDEIKVSFCLSSHKISMWNAFTYLTTSLPYRDGYGRRLKFFVTCNDHILGMVCLRSLRGTSELLDKHLGWTADDKWRKNRTINSCYDIAVCVSTRKYANLLTGKLLIYVTFSDEVATFMEGRYKNKEVGLDQDLDDKLTKNPKQELVGYMTTSLYGKSSIYNRIPFLKYLGLSKGFSGIYLNQEQWKEVYRDYMGEHGLARGDKGAKMVKFQMLAELNRKCKMRGEEYKYPCRDEAWRRGVYFGYLKDARRSLNEMVEEWRQRWLSARMTRIKFHPQEVKEAEEERLNALLMTLDTTMGPKELKPLF